MIEARLRRLAAAYLAESGSPHPSRIGEYRISRQIGAGGMGAVYLAERDDGQFDHRAAIKLVGRGLERHWAESRFRYERQVLAKLAHPNIAALLGGGATEDGTPYLLMEYVDGQPIDGYCDEHRLSIARRLSLFLDVCEAVSHAHRSLIVHRDIKPGNILVTSDGIPKLLDFGIAKMLAEDRDIGGCSETMRLMTPRYASPEQLRGDPITTATDVYSLGVVLYELVTGASPFGGPGLEPARPSAVATVRLLRDLDYVVLMAIRSEPERRYMSVEQFAADIRRCLAGLPVMARQGTFGYRAARFVRRHRVSVAAAAMLALSLLAGVSATLWQVRRVAEQVARTERRFIQFRKLANAFLFDFHDRIERLNDVSEARVLVLNTGIEYLDALAREAGDDPILRRELARAYEKVGDLQGHRHRLAMGHDRQALNSYRKAVDLLRPKFDAGSADAEALALFSRSVCSLGEMIERTSGDREAARVCYRDSLQAAQRIRKRTPRTLGLLDRASRLLSRSAANSKGLASAEQPLSPMKGFDPALHLSH
jgi:hypothetical protein